MSSQETELLPLTATRSYKKQYTIGVIIVLFILSIAYLQVNLFDIIIGFPNFTKFFFEEFMPPKFEGTSQYFSAVLDTILFAFVGTVVSSVFALLLGLIISERTNKNRYIRSVVRFTLTFFRTIPVIIIAQILVYVFGIGPIAGILGLVIATIAFLARSYAESIDDIPASKLEALEAAGASKMQILIFGVIPAFKPAWLSWSLFTFEINIRASVLLGLVGAGGIGMAVMSNIRLFRFRTASAIIIIIIILVISVEMITSKLRKMVR